MLVRAFMLLAGRFKATCSTTETLLPAGPTPTVLVPMQVGFGTRLGVTTGPAIKPANAHGTVAIIGSKPVNRPHWWFHRRSPCNRTILGGSPKTQ